MKNGDYVYQIDSGANLECQMEELTAFDSVTGHPILLWLMKTNDENQENLYAKIITDRSGERHEVVDSPTHNTVFTNYIVWTKNDLKQPNNSSSISRLI